MTAVAQVIESGPVAVPERVADVLPVVVVEEAVPVVPSSGPRWRLTHEGETALVAAESESDARAVWNDHRQKWPSPKDVDCVRV